MNKLAKITDIDISKPARALAWLRLTEYALVILCGSVAIDLLSDLVIAFPSSDAERLVSDVIGSLILGLLAYTGWRHAGVINPTVWKTYRVVLMLLVSFCLFIVTWGLLTTFRSDTNTKGQESHQNQPDLFVAALTGHRGRIARLDITDPTAADEHHCGGPRSRPSIVPAVQEMLASQHSRRLKLDESINRAAWFLAQAVYCCY